MYHSRHIIDVACVPLRTVCLNKYIAKTHAIAVNELVYRTIPYIYLITDIFQLS